jgi:hypothetical protein
VLAVQAVLSLRLVWSGTAFQDEAAYLWAACGACVIALALPASLRASQSRAFATSCPDALSFVWRYEPRP